MPLDKGWKWHAGDNADWARPAFDDATWEQIDPGQDIMDIPQLRQTNWLVPAPVHCR